LLMAANCGGEVTTPEPPNVRISPQALSVVVGSPALTFTATVARSSASVIWSLKGEGSLSSTKGASVDYTAPASVAADTTAEITATLEGTTVSDKAVVTIQSTATAPGTGVITVTIAGLGSANSAVTVTGPNGFNQNPTTTKTFTNLPPGRYNIMAQEVVSGADKYQPDKATQSVDLKAGETLEAKITYSLSLGTLYVNPTTGADTNSGAKDKPFKTITKALAQAVAGQTVMLASEAYATSTGESFPLRVKSGVTLQGETFPGVVIGGAGFCIELKDVQDIRLLKLGLQCDASIVLSNAKNITIEQLNSASKNTGIVAQDSSATIIASEIYFSSQEGLRMTGSSQVVLTDSKLFQNGFGVRLENTSRLEVDNSRFTENTASGIFVLDTASLTLKNSRADNNGNPTSVGHGLTVNSTGDGTITIDNATFNNNWSGINLQCGYAGKNLFDLTVTNSTFTGNTNYGVCVGDAGGVVELRKNLFGFNKVFQLSNQAPDNQVMVISAAETTIDDGMGAYDLSGLKTGPNFDTDVWEITGANNYICFNATCIIL
jgi:parallel beta-helix repeat protein